jgi:hypothetical protein
MPSGEEVRFDRGLYAVEAVHAAVEAYAELGTFEVVEEQAEVLVRMTDPDPELAAVLLDELSNHVLHETVRRRNAADAEGLA